MQKSDPLENDSKVLPRTLKPLKSTISKQTEKVFIDDSRTLSSTLAGIDEAKYKSSRSNSRHLKPITEKKFFNKDFFEKYRTFCINCLKTDDDLTKRCDSLVISVNEIVEKFFSDGTFLFKTELIFRNNSSKISKEFKEKYILKEVSAFLKNKELERQINDQLERLKIEIKRKKALFEEIEF